MLTIVISHTNIFYTILFLIIFSMLNDNPQFAYSKYII